MWLMDIYPLFVFITYKDSGSFILLYPHCFWWCEVSLTNSKVKCLFPELLLQGIILLLLNEGYEI